MNGFGMAQHTRERNPGETGRSGERVTPTRIPLQGWLLSLPFLAFLVLPVAALLLRVSPSQVWQNLFQLQVYQAISLSLLTSTATTVLTLLFGTPLAYHLARSRFRGRGLIQTLIDLPTVLPPAVAGVALLMAFGRRGIFGGLLAAWDVDVAFTPIAVILAQTFIAGPLYLKAATIGFTGIEPELEEAAALDGAGGWRLFRHVTLPLSWSALVGGIVLTWARALGEFGATIIFAGNFPGRTQTMPLAIYLGFHLDLSVALTLSVILIGFSFLTLIIVKSLLDRNTA